MQAKIAHIRGGKRTDIADAAAEVGSATAESGAAPFSTSEARAPSVGTSRPRRLNALTSVRALFALMVMYHHFVGYHALPMPDWAADAGNIAVSWFFILSGFILAYNFPVLRAGEETLRYVVSRFWRLFPVHAVTILASIVLFTRSGLSMIRTYPANLLASLTLTHTWGASPFASQAFNVPAWSISIEWAFYLLLPVLMARGWLVRALLAVAAFAIAATWGHSLGCFASQANFQAPGDSFHASCYQLFLYWPPGRLWEFTLGIALCSLSRRIRTWLTTWRGCGFVQLTLTALVLWAFFDRSYLIGQISYGYYSGFFGSWVITALLGAALILALSLHGPLDRALSWPALVFLGDVSFSVYLTHMLVLRFADTHQIGYAQPMAVQFAGVCAVTVAISIGLFLYVEKPSRLMLRKAFAASPDGLLFSIGIFPIRWRALLQLQPQRPLRHQADDLHRDEPNRPRVDPVLAPKPRGHGLALIRGRGGPH